MKFDYKLFIIIIIGGLFHACAFFFGAIGFTIYKKAEISILILLGYSSFYLLALFIRKQYNTMTPGKRSVVTQVAGLIALITALLRACA